MRLGALRTRVLRVLARVLAWVLVAFLLLLRAVVLVRAGGRLLVVLRGVAVFLRVLLLRAVVVFFLAGAFLRAVVLVLVRVEGLDRRPLDMAANFVPLFLAGVFF